MRNPRHIIDGRLVVTDYRENHYVPQWYQKRFLLDGQHELFYRDLTPATFRDSKHRLHTDREVRRRGPSACFVERDLYTRYLGKAPSTEIERIFMGRVDMAGKAAVEAFSAFSIANALSAQEDLLTFMGVQKFRTPKGLNWIKQQARSEDRDEILHRMIDNRRMYFAIWSECVWLIADASQSATKFIVSDHPVTVYNRRCGPSSSWCRGDNDPDLVLAATQTIFPLSLEKVLLLTNLTWVRNPYQDPVGHRPNPKLTRIGVFKAMEVQTERHLSEREVLEVNFIIRSRSRRYIAAAAEEWLYPERRISKSDWPRFGAGYLLMPDPRGIDMGGTLYMVDDRGRTFTADEYGRLPWEGGFESEEGKARESVALYRFKGEFARLHGQFRRGRATRGPDLEPDRESDDLHKYHLGLEEENRKRMKGQPRW